MKLTNIELLVVALLAGQSTAWSPYFSIPLPLFKPLPLGPVNLGGGGGGGAAGAAPGGGTGTVGTGGGSPVAHSCPTPTCPKPVCPTPDCPDPKCYPPDTKNRQAEDVYCNSDGLTAAWNLGGKFIGCQIDKN